MMYNYSSIKNVRNIQNNINERKLITDVHFISYIRAKDDGQEIILWSLQLHRTSLKIKGETNCVRCRVHIMELLKKQTKRKTQDVLSIVKLSPYQIRF